MEDGEKNPSEGARTSIHGDDPLWLNQVREPGGRVVEIKVVVENNRGLTKVTKESGGNIPNVVRVQIKSV